MEFCIPGGDGGLHGGNALTVDEAHRRNRCRGQQHRYCRGEEDTLGAKFQPSNRPIKIGPAIPPMRPMPSAHPTPVERTGAG